jgi:ABC-type multidrug transport system fused ATPase/permease subunit
LVLPLCRGQRRRIIVLIVTSLIGGLLEAAMLILLARIAFALAAGQSEVHVSNSVLGNRSFDVWELLGAAATLTLVRMGLQWITTVMSNKTSLGVMLKLRRSLVRSYLRASWDLQSSQREGYLQQLVAGYTSTAAGAIGGVTNLITSGLSLAALLAAALLVQPLASIGAALAALAIGLTLRPMRFWLRRMSREKADAYLALATGITELASTLQEVRIFGVEQPVEKRLDNYAVAANDIELKSGLLSGVIPTIYQGATAFFVLGALAIAYAAHYSGLGAIGAIVLIMLRSLSYAQSVQSAIQSLHATAPYIELINDDMERYRASAARHGGRVLDHIGSLGFDDVTFEYTPGVPVLKSVSFTTLPGEIIGIVGPSGAGKSTLVQVLLRLRDPTTGRLLVEGEDAATTNVDSWYDHMTFVPQDPRLFAGSVADNIRFFRDDADQADIERAAKLAHIHDDIISWREGYDTPVGERGGRLSGGQRQRLCIARALVEDPDVLVLDEPTSALDVKSEALLRETMASLAPQHTVVIIAHRLSTLSICHRIMVILNGELQGFDAPDALEASNPFYREALRLSGMR